MILAFSDSSLDGRAKRATAPKVLSLIIPGYHQVAVRWIGRQLSLMGLPLHSPAARQLEKKQEPKGVLRLSPSTMTIVTEAKATIDRCDALDRPDSVIAVDELVLDK
jgi:hypothetical protein